MPRNPVGRSLLILLVQEDPAESALTCAAVEQDGGIRCRPVERLSTALARIAGGDVDLVLLDVSGGAEPGSRGLDGFLKLRHAAPDTPIVVLCSAPDEGLALKAMRAGAADYVVKEASGDGMGRAIRTAVQLSVHTALSSSTGKVIALVGAKGGAGVTTVALNVAAALALQRNKVTLVEMHASFGALSAYFRPSKIAGNLWHLLELAAAGPSGAQGCLWPCDQLAGLSVLFGPQSADECRPILAARVPAVLQALAANADYVVVDLQASLSEANRTVIENASMLALVVERDPVSVQLAAQMRLAVESWGAPAPAGTIVVSRAPLRFPMSLAEIDSRLGIPALGVVPAEPDLCQSAQNNGTPLVMSVPESQIAGSLVSLAGRLGAGRPQLAGAV